MEKANKRMPSSSFFAVILLYFITVISSRCKFAYATDTLLPGQSLQGDQTLISSNGAFKMGFNCPSYPVCSSDYTFGIWYNSSTCSPGYSDFLVWAPTASMIFNSWSSSFRLSEYGNLHLTSGNSLIWSSSDIKNISVSAVAMLLDNGNLVIRDQMNSSMVLWQSFDNPIGRLLPGGWLGYNRITGKNVSLVSSGNIGYYGIGSSIMDINTNQTRGFVIHYSGSSGFTKYSGTLPSWMGICEDGNSFLLFNNTQVYLQLDQSGTVSAAKLGDCNSIKLWSKPDSVCDFDSYCGPNRICAVRSPSPYTCKCYDDSTLDCSANASLICRSNVPAKQKAYFHPIGSVYRFPDRPRSVEIKGTRGCEAVCSSDCSCTAYALNRTCLLWYGELHNTVLDSGSRGILMYKIVTKQENLDSNIKIFVLAVIGVLILILVGLVLLWKYKGELHIKRPVNSNSSLIVFSSAQIKIATKSFSEKLGEGGFGCVFKGTLPDSSVVAVKKLKDLGHGEKQFRAEIQTIGVIQHVNLVHLFGFCAEGSKRSLVYEYVENGSLNSHLFRKSSSKLSWKIRYQIALGTSRGLAYLHEECKDRIIHCDMKPDNVLLDADFCPKIADFGMAKLLGRDFSRALTTIRGTIGYLAPEWISGLPITHKADVYSYGMMLLEIVSGRRNTEIIKEGEFTYFPIFAAVKVNEGDVMCLLDSNLDGDADVEQLSRACRVACWCLQDAEDHRPMMGQVVHMLEGVMDIEVPPIPRSLQNYVNMGSSSHSAGLDSF